MARPETSPPFAPDPHLFSLLEGSPKEVLKTQQEAARKWGCPEHGADCPLLVRRSSIVSVFAGWVFKRFGFEKRSDL